jgi:hypothetical protein
MFNAMVDKDGPITLEFKDDYLVPVGKNVEAWLRIISKIIYNRCDFHYQSWSKVQDEMVKSLEERVKI